MQTDESNSHSSFAYRCLITGRFQAEVICSVLLEKKNIRGYSLVDATTGIGIGAKTLPILLQHEDGRLSHILSDKCTFSIPPADDKNRAILQMLYTQDSPQRIFLSKDQPPFLVFLQEDEALPEGYSLFKSPQLETDTLICNLLLQNLGYESLCQKIGVHQTSHFAPKARQLPESSYFDEYAIPFRNKNNALINGLIKEIVKRLNDEMLWSPWDFPSEFVLGRIHSPLVHLCNTSGSGKTRTALELGNYTSVIYIKYAGNHGTFESHTAKYLIKLLKEKCLKQEFAKCFPIQHAALQRLIYICGQYCKNKKHLGIIVLDNAVRWFCGGLSDELLKSVVLNGICDRALFDGHSLEQLENFNSTWITNRVEGMPLRQDLDAICLKYLPHLVLVFDEAFALMKDGKMEEKGGIPVLVKGYPQIIDCYSILRGTLRHYAFYWRHTLSVTISTVAKYTQIYPPLHNGLPAREFKCKFLPPITLSGTCDAFNHGTLHKDSVEDWKKYIFGFMRSLHISSCGRPLWAVKYGMPIFRYMRRYQEKNELVYDYEMEMLYNVEPFDYGVKNPNFVLVLAKISPQTDIYFNEPVMEITDNSVVSLLSLSIAMTKFPCRVDSEELVRSGGMCLFNVESDNVRGAFLSEGIMNGVASYVVALKFDAIVDHLGTMFSTNSKAFIFYSEVGEAIERLLIIRSMVQAGRLGTCQLLRRNASQISKKKNICQSIFEPVSLEEFLVEFVGREATEKYLGRRPELKGSFVAFNHFHSLGADDVAKSPYDLIANYLSRGAALAPNSPNSGFSAVLPLVLENGSLSFAYIQTTIGGASKCLPSNDDLSFSSPQNKWRDFYLGRFGNWNKEDEIPPYVYIYHHIHYDEYFSEVIVDANDEYQPCLLVSGLHKKEGKFKQLMEILEKDGVDAWLDLNASLSRSWKLPSKDVETVQNWDNYYSS